MKAPRARFCWHCGKRLYQSKVFVEKMIHGYPRILHKACVKDALAQAERDRKLHWERDEEE